MSILRAKKVLEKELEILEMSSLLIELRHALAKQWPTENPETLNWALEQATMRLSTAVTHSFDVSATRVAQST